MILEIELVKLFKKNGYNLYHTVPSNAEFPYVLYDRVSTVWEYIPSYTDVVFAYDVCGKDMQQVSEALSDILTMLEELEKQDDRFVVVEIQNVIDNSMDDSKVVYTITVNFRYNKKY